MILLIFKGKLLFEANCFITLISFVKSDFDMGIAKTMYKGLLKELLLLQLNHLKH